MEMDVSLAHKVANMIEQMDPEERELESPSCRQHRRSRTVVTTNFSTVTTSATALAKNPMQFVGGGGCNSAQRLAEQAQQLMEKTKENQRRLRVQAETTKQQRQENDDEEDGKRTSRPANDGDIAGLEEDDDTSSWRCQLESWRNKRLTTSSPFRSGRPSETTTTTTTEPQSTASNNLEKTEEVTETEHPTEMMGPAIEQMLQEQHLTESSSSDENRMVDSGHFEDDSADGQRAENWTNGPPNLKHVKDWVEQTAPSIMSGSTDLDSGEGSLSPPQRSPSRNNDIGDQFNGGDNKPLPTIPISSKECNDNDEPKSESNDDYSTFTVILEQKRASDRDFGFTVGGGKEKELAVVVNAVIVGSSADKGGLHVGDQLLTINSEPLRNKYHSSVSRMLHEALRLGEVELTVQRKRKEHLTKDGSKPDRSASTTIEDSSSIVGFDDKRRLFNRPVEQDSYSLFRRQRQPPVASKWTAPPMRNPAAGCGILQLAKDKRPISPVILVEKPEESIGRIENFVPDAERPPDDADHEPSPPTDYVVVSTSSNRSPGKLRDFVPECERNEGKTEGGKTVRRRRGPVERPHLLRNYDMELHSAAESLRSSSSQSSGALSAVSSNNDHQNQSSPPFSHVSSPTSLDEGKPIEEETTAVVEQNKSVDKYPTIKQTGLESKTRQLLIDEQRRERPTEELSSKSSLAPTRRPFGHVKKDVVFSTELFDWAAAKSSSHKNGSAKNNSDMNVNENSASTMTTASQSTKTNMSTERKPSPSVDGSLGEEDEDKVVSISGHHPCSHCKEELGGFNGKGYESGTHVPARSTGHDTTASWQWPFISGLRRRDNSKEL